MTTNENGAEPSRPSRRHHEAASVERRLTAVDDRANHRLAPRVGALRGPRVPDAGGPVLGVEVPAHAPDRNRRDDDRGQRQPDLEPASERGRAGSSAPRAREWQIACAIRATSGPRARSRRATPVRAGTSSTRSHARRSSPRVTRRTNRRSGTITKYARRQGKDDVADHRDERREDPQRRSVEAHAADVNRKQHGQERRDPAAIGRDPVLFGLLEPRAGLGEALGPIDADVGDDALIRLALGVDGRRGQIDRRRGQPQARGEPDHPVRGVPADQQDRERDSQIPGRGACGLQKGLAARPSDGQPDPRSAGRRWRTARPRRSRARSPPARRRSAAAGRGAACTRRSSRRSVARRTSCAGIPGRLPRRRRRGGTGPPRAPAPPPRAAPAMRATASSAVKMASGSVCSPAAGRGGRISVVTAGHGSMFTERPRRRIGRPYNPRNHAALLPPGNRRPQ